MLILPKCSLNRLSHPCTSPFLLFVTGFPVTKTASLVGRYLSGSELGEQLGFIYGLIDLIIIIAAAVL